MIRRSRGTSLEQPGEQWRTQVLLILFSFPTQIIINFPLPRKDFSSIARQFSLFSSWINPYVITLAGERIQGNCDLLGNEFARLWIFFPEWIFPKDPFRFHVKGTFPSRHFYIEQVYPLGGTLPKLSFSGVPEELSNKPCGYIFIFLVFVSKLKVFALDLYLQWR